MQLKINNTIVDILTTSGATKFVEGHNRDVITITFDITKITADGLINLFRDFKGNIEIFDNTTGEKYIHENYHILVQVGVKNMSIGQPTVVNPNPVQLVSFIELGKLTEVEKNMKTIESQQYEIEFLKMFMGVE